MSVVGFDLGNESCIVAVARQRGIDVVLNDESKRETPAIVCFGDKQRFIGTAGASSSMMNPKNSISQIKRLVGRKFSDPDLQRDIQSLPFSVTEGPDGFPLINARYLGEQRSFTPTQVLGMLLSYLKEIAEKNLNAAVVDCCIGIPVYFTDLQRRAVMDAAVVAGLHPLRLFHDTTATAMAYGIYKTDLPENDQVNVAFVDVGHASMQVCIAGFKKGQLKILAHAFDQSLGGRDFDEALFKHFTAKFKEEYKIDVYQNARACLRLRAACEKLKKVLSANPEAPLNIECLMEEKDVRGVIKRDEFESISVPILERVKVPLEKALQDAGLSIENIHSVEVVGSGSRVPAIMKILTEFFAKEPRRTMNASECVARGCALQCAILSPTFRVREFQVHESFPFPIALSWKASSSESQTGAVDNQQSSIVFPKGNPIPCVKALTFYRSSTFSIDVMYTDASGLQTSPRISTYTIGPFKSTEGNRAKLKVKVRLNVHGIVSVESATMLEDEEVDVPVSASKDNWKEAVKVDTDEGTTNSSATAESDVNMHEVKIATDSSGLGVENGVPETEEKSTRMETDTKLPWWETRGAILVALLHAGPVEFIYYWLHRALHHHFLYSRYHSHHHASIVTEPIISVIHPFGEEMAYFLLFAIPLMSMAFTGTGSIASLIGYLMYIDFMNYLGHCNFELVPKWLFEAFPPLKYLMHTPSFHSLHHTQFRTNYSLFVPFYDYVYGTVDKSSDKLYKTCVKGKGEEVPVVVHLTQLTTMESIYHLRLGFASLSSRPYEPKWYILLLSPLKFASMLLTWAYGTTFTVERSRMRMLHAETWAIPRYSFQYKSLSQREDINDLIEKAILEAEDRGAKVMSFGLMNQYGELYRKNNLKLRIKLVDGTSLAAAVVLNTLPLGTKETLLVGKLSKLSYVLALALCQKSIQVVVPRREVYETLKLKFPQELQDYVVFSKDYSCEDFA